MPHSIFDIGLNQHGWNIKTIGIYVLSYFEGVIKFILVSGLPVPVHAGELKGKLMLAASQLWVKFGRAFLLAISVRQLYMPTIKDHSIPLGKAQEVFFDRRRLLHAQFSEVVTNDVLSTWIPLATQIFAVILVATVLALVTFRFYIRDAMVRLFVDAESMEGALVKG